MKRFFKLLALTLACVVICTSLVGCDKMIEDLKARSATILDNGNFLVDGEEYILLPDGDYGLNYEGERILYLEDEEIPTMFQALGVAITKLLGGTKLFNEGRLLYYVDYSDDVYQSDKFYVYCRADIYDSVVRQINDGIEYVSYGYEYISATMDTKVYYLTEEETELINTVITTVKAKTIANVGDEYDEYDEGFELREYSEDKLFENYFIDVSKNGDTFFLRKRSDYTSEVYDVPQELSSDFDKLLKGAVNREAY